MLILLVMPQRGFAPSIKYITTILSNCKAKTPTAYATGRRADFKLVMPLPEHLLHKSLCTANQHGIYFMHKTKNCPCNIYFAIFSITTAFNMQHPPDI